MRLERLSNILDITMGKTPARKDPNYWGKGHKWVSIRDLKQKVITETKEEITDLALKKTGIKQVAKGTLLFSFKLTIGKMAFAGTNLYTNEAIAAFVIKDPKILDSNYLYYALKSANLVGSNQAAMGKTLNSKSLAAIEIPLPDDINDQKRIAHLLGKVESLINQRKQNIQQLNDLLKSVFLDMFGDPKSNPHNFPIRILSSFYVNPKEGTKCGPFGSALKKDEYVSSGVSVWNMDNIDPKGRMISPFRMWITSEKYADLSSYSVIDGDIVISRAGTVGKMCVAKMNGVPSIISTNLIRLRFGNELRPLYFVSLMTYCKSRVGRLKVGPDGTFTHMNTGILDKLEFPYPPLELQDKFENIVKKTEEIRTNYELSLIDLETLYSSLSQKAFKGELDLSKIPLPDESEEVPDDMSSVDQNNMTENNKENSILGFSQFNPESIKDNEIRKTQLTEWFNEWLEHYQQESDLNINHFWQCIEFTTQDYVDENDEPLKIEVSDYDYIKDEIFAAIKSGVIKQTTNMIETVVDGKTQLAPGNQILLKKQH
ncbi:restriction endonuclease subunit S [Pseudoalteromonas sp. APC 3691]|uniref:restriction endonuclease subunit S n=1 Tax=Pseudoalteromonas sp. APC 3691 TaxID=3035173 RepID=UPI0025B5D4AE|nr:restriction endonuclease subunit S [Pseudoalteromonas sp. APC 3691]MDN3390718.1 restriction endonuclease subunit S [Pseudoalteromonas sp. APC 3691]